MRKFFNVFLVIILFGCLIVSSCTKKNPIHYENNVNPASCEGCHTDYARLQEVYSPDTGEVSGGCGGDAIHFEPFDRVYIGGEGYKEYRNSGHYEVGCAGCHNGVDNTADKEEAHSGDFITHPSMYYKEICGNCHNTITENFTTSLHHGTGQKRKVTIRSGLNGPEDFDKLPESHKEGYSDNCAICHGTCGNCHVVRPKTGGGGLSNGHMFNKTPDMNNICITCHISRGGHAYLGVASGTVPDVHLSKLGYTCLDCHNGDELHGDGKEVNQRYAYDKLPKCENCHTKLSGSNQYHAMHLGDFNCQMCHSQDYNSCGSCHVHGEGTRIPSYQDFKIAVNPLPEIKDFNFVTVRKTPSAPDTWERYGVESYAMHDALPTYNYTSPHNIIKWTNRTKVEEGKSCSANCHLRVEDGKIINEDIYLFEKDLHDYEKGASTGITVDNKLPKSWTETK